MMVTCNLNNLSSIKNDVEDAFNFLIEIPEYFQEINKLKKEILFFESLEIYSGACSSAKNAIYLNPHFFISDKGVTNRNKLVGVIALETYNLASMDQRKELLNRVVCLNPNQAVRELEKQEYETALKVRKLIRGHFPVSDWDGIEGAYIAPDFELHYLQQQVTGHSREAVWKFVKRQMPPGSEYTESWNPPLSYDEKKIISDLIKLKIKSLDEDIEIADAANSELSCFIANLRKNKFREELAASVLNRLEDIEFFKEDLKKCHSNPFCFLF